MKNIRITSVIIFTLAIIFFKTSPLSADQSNFSLLPVPLPYPYFEPGRTDFRIAAAKASLSGNNIDLNGGGAYFMGRHAFNEYVAIDGLIGAFGANGDMPGFALPFIFQGIPFEPVYEGKGKLTGFGVPFALDLEVQLIHKPVGSLILFGGPNMSVASLTLDTPYHAFFPGAPPFLLPATAESTNFETKSSVFMGGAQVGAQAGINIGPITVAPFYMVISQSGSATFTFDDGYRGTDQIQGTSTNIEPFVVTATGFDVIIRPWNLSIGTLIQDAGSTTNQEGYKVKVFQLTWHFRTK